MFCISASCDLYFADNNAVFNMSACRSADVLPFSDFSVNTSSDFHWTVPSSLMNSIRQSALTENNSELMKDRHRRDGGSRYIKDIMLDDELDDFSDTYVNEQNQVQQLLKGGTYNEFGPLMTFPDDSMDRDLDEMQSGVGMDYFDKRRVSNVSGIYFYNSGNPKKVRGISADDRFHTVSLNIPVTGSQERKRQHSNDISGPLVDKMSENHLGKQNFQRKHSISSFSTMANNSTTFPITHTSSPIHMTTDDSSLISHGEIDSDIEGNLNEDENINDEFFLDFDSDDDFMGDWFSEEDEINQTKPDFVIAKRIPLFGPRLSRINKLRQPKMKKPNDHIKTENQSVFGMLKNATMSLINKTMKKITPKPIHIHSPLSTLSSSPKRKPLTGGEDSAERKNVTSTVLPVHVKPQSSTHILDANLTMSIFRKHWRHAQRNMYKVLKVTKYPQRSRLLHRLQSAVYRPMRAAMRIIMMKVIFWPVPYAVIVIVVQLPQAPENDPQKR